MNTPKINTAIKAVRGMNDILPQDSALWELFENTAASILKSYGYQQIRTPLLEHTELFKRGIGEATDVVEKEMFTFADRAESVGDVASRSLTLRPENTAAVVRAAVEHNLLYEGPKRLWYVGPMFRHEKPQRGRFRQFHQVGAEALGFAGADTDAEVILASRRLLQDLGLERIELQLNSLGKLNERQAHRQALVAYFQAHHDKLDEDSQRRLLTNPLRILDSKNREMQSLIEAAPKLMDYLGEESRAHFVTVQSLLTDAGQSFSINPRLVRGLDYYNDTVFEWVSTELGAQGTVCGGGRYDTLVEQIGGKPTPACGWAAGVERLLDLMKTQGQTYADAGVDVYVVHQGTGTLQAAFKAAENLRDHGFMVAVNPAGASFKSQMKKADASGAQYALIIGENELAQNAAALKPLREEFGAEQKLVPFAELADVLENLLPESTHSSEHSH